MGNGDGLEGRHRGVQRRGDLVQRGMASGRLRPQMGDVDTVRLERLTKPKYVKVSLKLINNQDDQT